jgi:diacylglycerol kinase family enzyme
LVGNPTSQSGRGLARIDLVLQHMRDRALDVTFLPTEPEGRTVGLVGDAIDAGGVDVVVYVGGDGTFAEVAKGVLRASHHAVMGMMPAGTANDQGKSFGIGSGVDDVGDNVDLLVADHQILMDVGHIQRLGPDGQVQGEDLWFDNVGFGLVPAILARRNRDRELVGQIPLLREIYRDQAVYVGAVLGETLRSYVEPVKFAADIGVGNEQIHVEGLTDILINNTPMFGGEWVPDRTTVADDGLLDLAIMQGRRDMISKLVLDHKATPFWTDEVLGSQVSQTFRAERFDITLLMPRVGDVPAQIDGEEWTPGTHFIVDLRLGRLPLIVRQGFVPPWWPNHG